MNFVAWFANVLINLFGFEADMSVGLSVILGIFVLLSIVVGFSYFIVRTATKIGWIKE